jgi:hypothetical protein
MVVGSYFRKYLTTKHSNDRKEKKQIRRPAEPFRPQKARRPQSNLAPFSYAQGGMTTLRGGRKQLADV